MPEDRRPPVRTQVVDTPAGHKLFDAFLDCACGEVVRTTVALHPRDGNAAVRVMWEDGSHLVCLDVVSERGQRLARTVHRHDRLGFEQRTPPADPMSRRNERERTAQREAAADRLREIERTLRGPAFPDDEASPTN